MIVIWVVTPCSFEGTCCPHHQGKIEGSSCVPDANIPTQTYQERIFMAWSSDIVWTCKGKTVPSHAMWANVEIEVYLYTFLNLGTIRSWVESFMLRPLCRLGQGPWFLLSRTSSIDCRSREISLASCLEVARVLTRMQEFYLRLCVCACVCVCVCVCVCGWVGGGGWNTRFKWALNQKVWTECTSTPKGYVKYEICVVHLKHQQLHKNSLCSSLLSFTCDCKINVNNIVMHKKEIFLSNTCTSSLIYILNHILTSLCMYYWLMF